MMTVEQFLKGYEHSAEEIPKVLDEWGDLDEDLRFEYCEQLEWLVDHAQSVEPGTDAAKRVDAVHRKLAPLKARILDIMGVTLPEPLPKS